MSFLNFLFSEIIITHNAIQIKKYAIFLKYNIAILQRNVNPNIDILDISGGMRGFVIPGVTEQGYFADVTKAIKEVINIPVILTGGITDVNVVEQLLKDGKADLIGVGRAIYKDSTWAKNAIESLK